MKTIWNWFQQIYEPTDSLKKVVLIAGIPTLVAWGAILVPWPISIITAAICLTFNISIIILIIRKAKEESED